MKTALALALAVALAPTLQAWVMVLDTPSFVIELTDPCPEGVVSCGNIQYLGISKKTGKSVRLVGSTVHTIARDGKSPSHFWGYRFINGSTIYFVNADGTLEVRGRQTTADGHYLSAKLLFSEEGKWLDDDDLSKALAPKFALTPPESPVSHPPGPSHP